MHRLFGPVRDVGWLPGCLPTDVDDVFFFHRAMNSLNVDTERLETECQVYRREMKRREDLDRNSRRSLSTDMFPPSTVEEMHRDVVER